MRKSTTSRSAIVLGALVAAVTAPDRAVAGQDEQDSPSPTQAATTRISEQAAYEAARNALVAQRITALGLNSSATGKTELKENGGEFEGWLLSASSIDKAADLIAADIRTRIPGQRAVLLEAGEEFDLGLPAAMKQRMTSIAGRANVAYEAARCGRSTPPPTGSRGAPSSASAAAAIPYLGAIIGALKTDTTITAFAGPTEPRLLVNALARQLKGDDWIVPGDISRIDTASKLWTDWQALGARRSDLARCRGPLAASAGKNQAALAQVAALDTSIAEIDAFEASEVIGGEGTSRFVQASRLEKLADQPLAIVRVFVEKAGGSILQRSNLLTMLGAPAVGITGGSVVGFRIADATTGRLLGGGSLACHTALTNMRSIHAGRVRPSRCAPALQAPQSQGGGR